MQKQNNGYHAYMGLEKAVIHITGDIVSDRDADFYKINGFGNGYISPCMIFATLDELEARTPVEIHLNSNGGDVQAGLEIANRLENRGNVVCHVDGWAASIASVIALSCEECIMPSNTFLMIHNPWTQTEGNAKELSKKADFLQKITESMIDFYTARARVPRETITEMMDSETWLTALEAEDTFYKVKTTVEEKFKIVAKINPKFARIPKTLKEFEKDEIIRKAINDTLNIV